MSRVHSVVVLARPDVEGDVVSAIAAHKEHLEVTRRCADLAEVLAAARAGIADIACVDASDPDLDIPFLEEVHRCGCAVVLLADPQGIERVRSFGADAVIAEGAVEQLVESLLALARTEGLRRSQGAFGVPAQVAAPFFEAPTEPTQRARLITVCGTSGAPGRSTTAINVARVLAETDSTILIDGDTTNPSIAHMLSLPVEPSALSAVARLAARGRLTPADIRRAAQPLAPTFGILTGISNPQRWREVGPTALTSILNTARSVADSVVVDVAELDMDPPGDDAPGRVNKSDLAVAALRASDDIVLVGRCDPVGIHRLSLAVKWWDDYGPNARLHVVVNGCSAASAGKRWATAVDSALAPILPGKTVHLIARDDAIQVALLKGRTVIDEAPRTAAAQALRELAEKIRQAGGPPTRLRRSK